MTPHYQDDWLTIYAGDARDVMAEMPEASVDCVVTSPPYWGLRDYGTEGQIGLEPTPEEYVANMVAVFREVRRVLKPSGTCWLNLGDSYSSHAAGLVADPMAKSTLAGVRTQEVANRDSRVKGRYRTSDVLPEKNLVGIPWRVAFALQADGWYLRSDIIWAKKNGMPESVTDRPTRAHEYIFLLTKSPRYYYDIDAVRQEPAPSTVQRLGQNDGHPVWNGNRERGFPGSDQTIDINKMLSPGGANLRDVWWMATMPYPDAHFAVFPPELPERCIKAGSSEKGVCPECGAPWERVVERTPWKGRNGKCGCGATHGSWAYEPEPGLKRNRQGSARNGRTYCSQSSEVGWRPTCAHEAPLMAGGMAPLVPSPPVILDPFGGSGTVGMVANRLSRRAILIDLNPDYITQQMKRNANLPLGLSA